MKKHLWSKVVILAVMFFFMLPSISPAQIITEQKKAVVYENDIKTIKRETSSEPLIFVEPGPTQKSTLYADGSVIELQTQAVSRPMIGSDSDDITLDDFKSMMLSSREAFEVDENRFLVDNGGTRSGLNIVFSVSNPPSGALAALSAVETYIESLFSDDITVTISVNFAPMSPGILGGTSCYYAGSPSWSNTRNGLINDMDSDDTIQNWLPSGTTIPVRYNGFSGTVTDETRCFFTRANYNAAIGTSSGTAASMTFNNLFSWDYDPSNGVYGGTYCFQSVAAHETGHALGFTSGADFRSYDIEALDIYRFQRSDGIGDYNPDTLAEFQTTARMVDQNAPGSYDDVNSDLISAEYRMSDGSPYQCSHFSQGYVYAIMQPAFSSGTTYYPDFYKTPDIVMFDAIGWDYPTVTNNPPVVSDIPDQTIAEGGSFTPINLDDYVTDVEDPDSAIVWTYFGNIELTVSIDANRVATISTPNPDWNGAERIIFTAFDTGGLRDSDDAIFTVTPVNDPPNAPNNPSPGDGETGVILNPTLSVDVYDIDGDTMNVSFYDEYNTLIGTDMGVSSGSQASVLWSGLNSGTIYSWYAVADDGEYSTQSNIWYFTTTSVQQDEFYATQDIPVQNGGITNDYTSTHLSDDQYEGIQERESGGKPINRYTYLEHKWTIDVIGGYDSYVFYLEADHTLNSENDDFKFAYSTNDINYYDMITVTKTTDDNTYQTYVLPSTLTGAVYIRVKDTDQTSGNRNKDTIFIDHMYIEAGGTPPPNNAPDQPIDPDPIHGATDVSLNPTLSVYVSDPDGDTMDISFYDGLGVLIGTDIGVSSSSRASITWFGLDPTTIYNWYAVADDGRGGMNTSDPWTFTTTSEQPGGMYVWDISWSVKNAGKNTFLSHIVTVRYDSDGDGVAEATDALASDATVSSTLTNTDTSESWTFSGTTDSTGQIAFQQKCNPGHYEAFITDITHNSYTYTPGMNVDNPDYYTLT